MQYGRTTTLTNKSSQSELGDDYGIGGGNSLARFKIKDIVQGELILAGNSDDQPLRATCSASCLLQPLIGDEVLVYLDREEGDYFVLAVLKRASHIARQYALSENVNLLAQDGDLHIVGNALNLTAAKSEFKIDQFDGIYKDKSEKADTITTVAKLVRHQIDRVISRIRNSFRLIDGLDRTQAANIQQTAEHQILLRSDFTKVQSEHVVKVQAKKIDLG